MVKKINGIKFETMISMTIRYYFSLLILILTAFSCSSPGPGLFGKKTPHEQYSKKIQDAGLKETSLGAAWFKAAEVTLRTPLYIQLPYMETGYFSPDKVNAIGLKFIVKRGEKVTIDLSKNPKQDFDLYLDLWKSSQGKTPELLASADTISYSINYVAQQDDSLVLRLQSELLKEGEYTMKIITGPSLAFPISPKVKSNIGSYYGAGRDKGQRSHEGIDIFAPFRSEAIAIADGTISGVGENSLGGKVIFMRPDRTNFNLYYAHLDTQFVTQGQRVKTGDVIGLTGNTGNARFTPSHLHFGIYTFSGAIDPINFVKQDVKSFSKITAPLDHIEKPMRTIRAAKIYNTSPPQIDYKTIPENSLFIPEAATANQFRLSLPDGSVGFIKAMDGISVQKVLSKQTLKYTQILYSKPDSTSYLKKTLPPVIIIRHKTYFVALTFFCQFRIAKVVCHLPDLCFMISA